MTKTICHINYMSFIKLKKFESVKEEITEL